MQEKKSFVAYFFIWTTAAAQQYTFGSFTIEDGLSNNVVYATHQDSKGYLWIATHDGLNRYDGFYAVGVDALNNLLLQTIYTNNRIEVSF